MSWDNRHRSGPLAWVCSLAYDRLAAEEWAGLYDILDEGERLRAGRFLREDHRRAYIAAHALLRQQLSQISGYSPAGWRFATGEYGKPYLARPADPQLRFSLTHTRGMAAVAVALGVEVGIDAEHFGNRHLDMGGASYFSPIERQALRALPNGEAQRERFLLLWTLKEAVLKATGKGLSQPLSSFAFPRLDPPCLVVFDETLGDPGEWRLAQWRSGDHIIALAVRGGAGMEPGVMDRELEFVPPCVAR